MNKTLLICWTVAFLVFSDLAAQDFEHIVTDEIPVIDTFYGDYIIEDKYRWLEDIDSEQTNEWVGEQNKISKRYLTKASNKTNAFNSIVRYSYTKYNNPRKNGDYYYTYAFVNEVSVPSLLYQRALNADPEVLVDPNYISGKDRIMLLSFAPSKDSKYLAYQFSRNGSDWAELKVVSLLDKTHLKDHLVDLKFSNIAWKDNGFYYSTFLPSSQFDQTFGQQLYFHKIGTDQSNDILVYKGDDPYIRFSFFTTSDERFLVLKEENNRKEVFNIHYIDFNSGERNLTTLLTEIEYDFDVVESYNDKLIAITNYYANNGYIVEVDQNDPLNWRPITPEFTDALLLRTIPLKDKILTIYHSHQHPIITVHNYEGEMLYNQEFPVATSLGNFSGNWNDEEFLFTLNSYTIPPIVYKFNINTYKTKIFRRTKVTFDYTKIEYEEIECLSKDGVMIPIVLVYEKGFKRNGFNPAILKAYGGFGVIEQPSFDPGIVHFVRNGGVFVFANIRGGGDKGLGWALQGKGMNKQNSINDFISVADYLNRNFYTNPNKLAATGASNGGLVVAAAAIQRPDLFKAVVPVVAPLDMLRFEKFTVGHWHIDEYGTTKNRKSFENLYSYSPYHNIKEEINYPSMLIVTSENDDRVPPFHSYKFAARLQSRAVQKNPVILKVEKDAGHYGAMSLSSNIQELADLYGFIMYELRKN